MNRVVLITGASRGIGRACSLEFAREGDIVVVNYQKDSNSAEALASEIEGMKGTCMLCRADVSEVGDVQRMTTRVIDAFGQIDVLVNNAGISHYIPFSEITEIDWEHVMKVNLESCFLCSKHVLPYMQRQGSGRIINISSQAGISGSIFNGAHYAASKAGIINLTKCLAKQYAKFGILVNCVAPGVIDTAMTSSFSQQQNQVLLSSIPLKRFGLPNEVAKVVRFLASDDCSYITGSTISINGGLLMP